MAFDFNKKKEKLEALQTEEDKLRFIKTDILVSAQKYFKEFPNKSSKLDELCKIISLIFGVERVRIFLTSPYSSSLICRSASGKQREIFIDMRFSLGETSVVMCFKELKRRIDKAPRGPLRELAKQLEVTSSIKVPIIYKGKGLGVVCLDNVFSNERGENIPNGDKKIQPDGRLSIIKNLLAKLAGNIFELKVMFDKQDSANQLEALKNIFLCIYQDETVSDIEIIKEMSAHLCKYLGFVCGVVLRKYVGHYFPKFKLISCYGNTNLSQTKIPIPNNLRNKQLYYISRPNTLSKIELEYARKNKLTTYYEIELEFTKSYIDFYFRNNYELTKEDEKSLSVFYPLASYVLHKKKLQIISNREKDVLTKISQLIGEIDLFQPNMNSFFKNLAKSLATIYESPYCAILDYDSKRNILNIIASYGDIERERYFLRPEEGYSWRIFETGKPEIIPDTSKKEYNEFAEYFKDVKSAIYIPLKHGAMGRAIKILAMESSELDYYSEHDKEVLEAIKGSIAIALKFAEDVQLLKSSGKEREKWAIEEEIKYIKDCLIHDLGNSSSGAKAGLSKILINPTVESNPHIFKEVKDAYETLGLMDKFLTLLKIDIGPLNREKVDITSFLKEKLNSDFISNLKKKSPKMNLIEKIPDGPIMVNIDKIRFERVIGTVIENSFKYTEMRNKETENITKNIEVEVIGDSSDNKVIIKVRDEGIGIPKNKWEEVFHPLKRLNERVSGYGFGLDFARRTMMKMKGKIYFKDSEKNKFTLLVLELPTVQL